MSDSWDDMRRAKEEQYFQEQNNAALERLKSQTSNVKKSPITGKPMKQVAEYGVILDLCEDSGGVWLDKGELEKIIEHVKGEHGTTWSEKFFSFLSGKN